VVRTPRFSRLTFPEDDDNCNIGTLDAVFTERIEDSHRHEISNQDFTKVAEMMAHMVLVSCLYLVSRTWPEPVLHWPRLRLVSRLEQKHAEDPREAQMVGHLDGGREVGCDVVSTELFRRSLNYNGTVVDQEPSTVLGAMPIQKGESLTTCQNRRLFARDD
jgi:hypothetical protein